MSFRFSKRIRLLPGVRLNLSKSGVSASFGIPGASVTLGGRGSYLNLGVPGTGLSFRTRLDQPDGPRPEAKPDASFDPGHQVFTPELDGGPPAFQPLDNPSPAETPAPVDFDALRYTGQREFRSAHPDTLSSPHLKKLAELVSETEARQGRIKAALFLCRSRIGEAGLRLRNGRNWIARPFVSKARLNEIETRHGALRQEEQYLSDLLEGTVIDAFFGLSDEARSEYLHLRDAFSGLCRSNAIWDISTSADVDRAMTRSAASQELTRTLVKFDLVKLPEFDGEFEGLHLHNANGGDLYLYPSILAVRKPNFGFAFLDMRDVDIRFRSSSFIEEQALPADAERIGHVWAKSNKDGSPDRRFANNYQIPLLRYGEIALTSRTGLNEVYMISNARALDVFAEALKRYSSALARSKPEDADGTENVPFDQVPDLDIRDTEPVPGLFSAATFFRLALLAAGIAAVAYALHEYGGLRLA